MATPKKIVYVDTNAIIEATRTGCLKAILNHYDVRTVEEVRRESLHVAKDKKSYVKVDEALFRSQVSVSAVNAADVLRAAVKAPGLMTLDKGERDLLAHVAVMNDPGVWVLNSNMVLAYWLIGREIVQEIQGGGKRAGYGKQVLGSLNRRLTARFGPGFSETSLKYFRTFYLAYRNRRPLGDELPPAISQGSNQVIGRPMGDQLAIEQNSVFDLKIATIASKFNSPKLQGGGQNRSEAEIASGNARATVARAFCP